MFAGHAINNTFFFSITYH